MQLLLHISWEGNRIMVDGLLGMIGVATTQQSKASQIHIYLIYLTIFSVDIYQESSRYGSLSDVLQEVNLYYCDDVKCTWKKWLVEYIKDVVVTLYYPDLRFTFPMPELQPSQQLHTFSLEFNPKVRCKILLEDKERYYVVFILLMYMVLDNIHQHLSINFFHIFPDTVGGRYCSKTVTLVLKLRYLRQLLMTHLYFMSSL